MSVEQKPAIKVTDKRRFNSDGQPRDNGQPKCRACDGHGRLAVDHTPENLAMAEAAGMKVEDIPTTVDCPQCEGRGTA